MSPRRRRRDADAMVLVAIGRVPFTAGWAAEAGVGMDNCGA
jgi:hypothetical protein